MKEYKCPYAVREREIIMCSKINDLCGNVYYCRMGGRWKLTEASLKCPKRSQEKPIEKPKKRGKKNGQNN